MVFFARDSVARPVAFLLNIVGAVLALRITYPGIKNFACLFFLRYLRLIVHIIAFWLYRPAPLPAAPKYSEKDVTVIIPTVDPHSYLTRCLESVTGNKPSAVIIVTAGQKLRQETEAVVEDWLKGREGKDNSTNITVTDVPAPSKRHQMAQAIGMVNTKFIVGADDSVVWPSENLIRSILNAFEENSKVGLVGTNKRVRRIYTGSFWAQFWNFIGCVYLRRHNFEIRATNAINGGVFVVSGRTLGIRTIIAQDPKFLYGLTHETCLGQPLLPDDDNYIHRYMIKHDWDVKIQYCHEATIETNIGTYPRFLQQCLRWARTTFRSNPVLLAQGKILVRYPWTSFAAIITGILNFALVIDPLLVYLFIRSELYRDSDDRVLLLKWLIAWVLASKLVKLLPHFVDHPGDVVFFPGYVVFSYFHSLLKFYALLTFWNCSWSGRKLDKLTTDENDEDATHP